MSWSEVVASLAYALSRADPPLETPPEEVLARIFAGDGSAAEHARHRSLVQAVLSGEQVEGLQLTEDICERWNNIWARRCNLWLNPEEHLYVPPWHTLVGNTTESLWSANLAYLLNRESHGGVRKLAQALGAREETVSRWKCWRPRRRRPSKPRRKYQQAIHEFFKLGPTIDLGRDPYFLGIIDRSREVKKQKIQPHLDHGPVEVMDRIMDTLKNAGYSV